MNTKPSSVKVLDVNKPAWFCSPERLIDLTLAKIQQKSSNGLKVRRK